MSRVAIHADAVSSATPDRVFALLVDWPLHERWMPFTRAEGGHGVGADLVAWTGIGPVGFRDTMVITEWTPGRRVTVRHTGRLVRGEAFFEVTPLAEGGCRVRWMEGIDLPFGPLGRIGWLAAGPMIGFFLRVGLRRLARLAEAPGPAPASAGAAGGAGSVGGLE
ncbi:SRPBCC family protein [Actinomadura sp. SCN-SB]|uniref:SRPBCC family protein n=1 Tax=Actinomadura sp. SCN-SB TaxID=3373092 RepID=UPI00375275FC